MTRYSSALLVSLCLVGLCISALPASANQQSIPDAIEETGFVLLDGTTWNKMSPEAKYAFVWGMGHVAEIERELAQRNAPLRDEDFSAKMGQAMGGMSMSYIVNRVDEYYDQNPGMMDVSVAEVIWSQLIRPRISTGIAGKPLQ